MGKKRPTAKADPRDMLILFNCPPSVLEAVTRVLKRKIAAKRALTRGGPVRPAKAGK